MRTLRSAVNSALWTVAALLLVIAFILLGRWQWQRTYRPVDGYSAEPAAIPLETLIPAGNAVPAADLARQVTVSGNYVVAGSLVEWSGRLVGGNTSRVGGQEGGARRPRLGRRRWSCAGNTADVAGLCDRAS